MGEHKENERMSVSGPEFLQFWGSDPCVQIISALFWLNTCALSGNLANKHLVGFAWV